MNCNKIIEKIPLLILNELPSEEITEVKRHIDNCTSCQKEQEELNKIISRLGYEKETLKDSEHITLQNLIYKSVLDSIIFKQKSTRVRNILLQTAAALLIFASGYLISEHSFTSNRFNNQMLTTKTNSNDQANINKITSNSLKNSKIGFKIISKGKNVLEESR